MKRSIYIILIFVSTSFCHVFAQTEDAESWVGLRVGKKINKKLSFKFDIQHGRDNNFATYKTSFFETSAKYKLFKRVYIEGNIRFTDRIEYLEKRGNLSLYYKYKPTKRLTITNKIRYHRDYSFARPTDSHLRYKMLFDYNLRRTKWSPFVGSELFYYIGYKGNHFDRFRIYAGADYKINKRQELKLYIIRHWRLGQDNPLYSTLFVALYSINFK